MYQEPTGCLATNPTTISVFFAGKFINLSAISRLQGVNHTYLSKIFAGKRYPRVQLARKIAAALGMHVEEFYRALDDRILMLEANAGEFTDMYKDRIMKERDEDAAKYASGRVPLARLPGVYLPSDLERT